MKCAFATTEPGHHDTVATQLVLLICPNGHILERTYCDEHTSDVITAVEQKVISCHDCPARYVEVEARDLKPGWNL